MSSKRLANASKSFRSECAALRLDLGLCSPRSRGGLARRLRFDRCFQDNVRRRTDQAFLIVPRYVASLRSGQAKLRWGYESFVIDSPSGRRRRLERVLSFYARLIIRETDELIRPV